MGHSDAPDIDYPLPPLKEIPDSDIDKPKEACKLVFNLPSPNSLLCAESSVD